MWRVNNSIPQHPTHAQYLSQKLTEYFLTNTGSVDDPAILWNAHKSFMRGFFIQIGAKMKKRTTQQIEELTKKIATVDQLNKSNPSPILRSQIFKLRHELCSLLLITYELNLRKLKARSYVTNNRESYVPTYQRAKTKPE